VLNIAKSKSGSTVAFWDVAPLRDLIVARAMPVLAAWFPAAAKHGLRNIYQPCGRAFSGKVAPGCRKKMLSFNNLRVF
jgi:hypothetical protein